MKNKLIIVAGCSGSGKTTVSRKIKESFRKNDAQILCLDRFYKAHIEKIPKTKKHHTNFDHPDAFDWPLLKKTLRLLLNNKPAHIPVYDYIKHRRLKKSEYVKPTKIVIFEGFLALYDSQINKMAELKIYVDTSMNECFIRRLKRDQNERKRSVESIITQWTETVKPMYDIYVKPRRWVADFLMPWDKSNDQGLKYLTAALKAILRSKNG